MSSLAVQVEGVSKQYVRGEVNRHKTLRESLTRLAKRPFRRQSANQNNTFWALRDVSFEVGQGEVVGIIGRNGAGKSTLLKVLTRITHPTQGRVLGYGRVGSLLEVGTGFHPELSGRENVYLNGAVLGMTRAEINRKFDEIVAFSEVEKFLDTPVKHYSSGMYVRLAFAVAAHLEPEILIVDEVLAVGDFAFQKKCLNKMEDVGQNGRTVLFVSHSMDAISRLCPRAILLDQGRIVADGTTSQVISGYLNSESRATAERIWSPETAPGGDVARLLAVRVLSASGDVIANTNIGDPVTIEMEYEVIKPGYALMPFFSFRTENRTLAFMAHDLDPNWRQKPRPKGSYRSRVTIPGHFLAEGTMFVGGGLDTVNPTIEQCDLDDLVAFQVIDTMDWESARGDFGGEMRGVVRPKLAWQTDYRTR